MSKKYGNKHSVENTFFYTLTCLKQQALAVFRSNLPVWVTSQLPKHADCVPDWTISMENEEYGANLIMTLDIKVPEIELSRDNIDNFLHSDDKVSVTFTDKGKQFVIKGAKFFYCYSCARVPHRVGTIYTSFMYSETLQEQLLQEQYKEE